MDFLFSSGFFDKPLIFFVNKITVAFYEILIPGV